MTTKYDERLQELGHFRNMQEKLPFIGEYWDKQDERILFIPESHYISPDDFTYQTKTIKLDVNSPDSFYEILSTELTGKFKDYFNTRQIITQANKGVDTKAKEIYIKLKAALTGYTGLSADTPFLDYFSIYNYFQRPSYTAAGTIVNTAMDNRIAFETLIHITDAIKPTIIFFLSAKSYANFKTSNDKNPNPVFKTLKTYRAPHPSHAWWNKPSSEYDNLSGKEFVNKILSTKRKLNFV